MTPQQRQEIEAIVEHKIESILGFQGKTDDKWWLQASVKHYLETGKVSGSFFEAITKICYEAALSQPTKGLRLDQAWSIPEVVKKLIEAAEILLHKKDYDGHGWEEIHHAKEKAKKWLDEPAANVGTAPDMTKTAMCNCSVCIAVRDEIKRLEEIKAHNQLSQVGVSLLTFLLEITLFDSTSNEELTAAQPAEEKK